MTVLLRSWPKALAAIGQEILLHDLGVFVRQNHRSAGGSDEPIGTLDHAVTLARGLAFDLAGRRDFEALLGTALGLELGHLASLVWPVSGRLDGLSFDDWKACEPPRHAPPGGSFARPYRVD